MRKSVVLALSILCVGVPAWTAKKRAEVDNQRFNEKLSKDEQILHALDRLTFGPRPGDVDAVKKMGVKKWIDLQLHPDQIPESRELEKRLQPLESLRMNQADTAAQYPTQQVI